MRKCLVMESQAKIIFKNLITKSVREAPLISESRDSKLNLRDQNLDKEKVNIPAKLMSKKLEGTNI